MGQEGLLTLAARRGGTSRPPDLKRILCPDFSALDLKCLGENNQGWKGSGQWASLQDDRQCVTGGPGKDLPGLGDIWSYLTMCLS